MMSDKDAKIEKLQLEKDLLWESIARNDAIFEAINRLLESGLIIEARAVACCAIDRRFSGERDGDGGALGRLLQDRYEPYDYPGQPDYIVIEPRHHVKKETV